MPINPSDNDSPGYRTLAQLRTALIERLGFADALTPVTRTLAEVRRSMLYLLGYGAQVDNPPPGVAGTLNEYINLAQQALFRRLEMDKGNAAAPAYLVDDADVTELDAFAVQTLALADYCAHKGKPEAKSYFEQHEKYVGDVAARRPPGLDAKLTAIIVEAQRTLAARFPAMRTVRWFSWSLAAGERFYSLTANDEQTDTPAVTKQLDPYRITEAWIERDTVRAPLRHGIPSGLIAQDVSSSWPSHYEIHQAIEVWPAPSASEGVLRIKGHFKAEVMTDDADTPGFDDHAVYLLALANAKSDFKQPDANSIMAQSEAHLRQLVAGSHGTARYIPGGGDPCVYVEPRPSVPFA